MKPLIAGNWKMNGSRDSVKALLQGLLHHREQFHHVELAIFPPFIFMDLVGQYLEGSPIVWGGQNCNDHLEGAYTGEISVQMLREYQCRYVIIGHSERRTLYGETDRDSAAKFALALQSGVRPILCIGETAAERADKRTLSVIERQLAVALKLADNLPALSEAVIAYEPVWAIGTGQNAALEQVKEVHTAIRAQLVGCGAEPAKMRILYGGSVKPENAGALLALPDVDGALVGGASLKVEQFIEIARQCKHSF